MLGNYPPVDRFPATYGLAEYDFGNEYAKSFNIGLWNIVAGYAAYVKLGLVDVGALFEDIFADPAQYGIDEQYIDPPTAGL